MSNRIRITSILSLMLVLSTCSSPSDSKFKETYTPLSIGDETQIIYLADSSTLLFSIVGTTTRADGKNVYIGTFKYSILFDTLLVYNIDTLYYLISDEYFKTTILNKIDSNSYSFKDNPFVEQRIGKPFPKDGDTWIKVVSLNSSDYFVAEKYEIFMTLFGNVDETFVFKSYEYDGYPIQSTYYGKNMGWIGTSTSSGDIVQLCSYKKIKGIKYGTLWSDKPFKFFFKNYWLTASTGRPAD